MDVLLVKIGTGGEIERVDAAERVIRRLPDQLFDRIRHIRVSGVSQRREESFGLAHAPEDRVRQGCREGRSGLQNDRTWEVRLRPTAPPISRGAAVLYKDVR